MSEMMQVPYGWEVKKVSSLCKILDNQRIPLNDEERQNMKGYIPYYGANAIVDYIDNYLFDEDLILLAEDGGNFDEYENRPIAFKISGKSWVNNHAHILKPNKNIEFDYVFYSLEHKNITSYIRGGTRSKLNQSDLKDVDVLIPKEKKEQEKIAKILSTLDKAIESTNRLIEKEKNIKTALMQELLTNGIDQNGQICSPKTHTYKPTELGLIPDEWEVKKIGEICKFKQGIQIPIEEQSFDYETGKYRFLRISDYTQQTEDKRYVSEIYKDYLITDTDVVMVRYGETAGFVGINLSGVLANNLFRIIPIKKIDNQFLYYYLNSLYDAFKDMREAGAMPAISFSSLSRVYFPLFNIEEQKQIAKILTTQDKKIQAEEINLVKLKELKKGLMNDLLSGKVRVKI